MGLFRLLVYAIVTLAILALFFAYIMPIFFPTPNPTLILNENFNTAEMALGIGVTKEIYFQATGFTGETFDSDRRTIAFECNNGAVCCNIGQMDENCSQKIEWNQRFIEVKEPLLISTTTRCSYQNRLFVCKVYFGKKPAQIEIVETTTKEKVDLGEETPAVNLTIRNSGEVPFFYGTVRRELFEVYWDNGDWRKRSLGDIVLDENFGGIQAEAQIEREYDLEISSAGKYSVKLRVSGDNAGFEEKSFDIEAVGGKKCTFRDCDAAGFEEGECRARCYCQDCLSFECENVVRTEVSERGWAYSSVTALGSNIADVSLPDGFCS